MMYLDKLVLQLPNLWDSFWRIFEYPLDVGDNLPAFLEDVIEYLGFDFIYTATVIINLIVISYWKDFRNWDKQDWDDKMLVGSAVGCSVLFNLLSLLKLIGVLNI